MSDAFTQFLELERSARSIFSHQTLWVPGLLQTRPYAEAALASFGVGGAELAERVQQRMDRGEAFAERRRQDPSITLSVVLDEQVFAKPVGSVEVMQAQIRHLEELNTAGAVSFGLITRDLDFEARPDGSFVLLDGRAVLIEDGYDDRLVTDDEEVVRSYRDVAAALEKSASRGAQAFARIAGLPAFSR